jgi:hypothetical protein
MTISSSHPVPVKPSAHKHRTRGAAKKYTKSSKQTSKSSKSHKASTPKSESKKATTSTVKVDKKQATQGENKVSAKLFQAAQILGNALSEGKDPKVTAQETLSYLREQPETVAAFNKAAGEFDAWLAHRNSVVGRKAVGAAVPLIREGISDEAIEEASKAAGGEDTRKIVHHAVGGLRQAGIAGAIAALARFSESFKPTGEKMSKVAGAMSKTTAFAPGLKSEGNIAAGGFVTADLVLACNGFRDQSVSKGKRAGDLIKATASFALWVMNMMAKAAPAAA